MERSYGPFHRAFELPTSIETGQSKGRFQEGYSADGDHTEEGEREKPSDSHQ